MEQALDWKINPPIELRKTVKQARFTLYEIGENGIFLKTFQDTLKTKLNLYYPTIADIPFEDIFVKLSALWKNILIIKQYYQEKETNKIPCVLKSSPTDDSEKEMGKRPNAQDTHSKNENYTPKRDKKPEHPVQNNWRRNESLIVYQNILCNNAKDSYINWTTTQKNLRNVK